VQPEGASGVTAKPGWVHTHQAVAAANPLAAEAGLAILRAGGRAVQARTGHAFVKQAMRDHGAVYGGEMSAHHYFRDFMCCDSGMIPWLLVAELVGRSGKPLSGLVSDRMAAFPSSGEINFRLDDPGAAIARIEAAFASKVPARDETDGLSLAFDDWRLNLRRSNTEPLLRLNVEARGQEAGLKARVAQVVALIGASPESA
jgi:phosphomannomutase